jgi:hypothetical protein
LKQCDQVGDGQAGQRNLKCTGKYYLLRKLAHLVKKQFYSFASNCSDLMWIDRNQLEFDYVHFYTKLDCFIKKKMLMTLLCIKQSSLGPFEIWTGFQMEKKERSSQNMMVMI